MRGKMSDGEWEIIQEAYQYLADHIDPPNRQDAGAEAWWMAAAGDAAAVDSRWQGYPLMRRLLLAIYQYLGERQECVGTLSEISRDN